MKPILNEAASADDTTIAPQDGVSVTTRVAVAAQPGQVWNSLVFYEGIEAAPPWYLTLLLPRPIRTQGSKSAVGDQATCLYQGGHLLKKVIRIDTERLYEFTVVEQRLGIGGGILLTGGSYELRDLGTDRTELAITTRYVSGNRPRWLVQPVEEAVCHLFHHYLLNSIKSKAEGEAAAAAVSTAP